MVQEIVYANGQDGMPIPIQISIDAETYTDIFHICILHQEM